MPERGQEEQNGNQKMYSYPSLFNDQFLTRLHPNTIFSQITKQKISSWPPKFNMCIQQRKKLAIRIHFYNFATVYPMISFVRGFRDFRDDRLFVWQSRYGQTKTWTSRKYRKHWTVFFSNYI